MLNIKKAEVARNEAITASGILLNNFVSLSLIFALFCLPGHLYAQMPPALDFPQGREFDPRHPLDPRESGISPSAISENVELVGATEGAVFDVFVQDNYAYICAGVFLTILDVSVPSNPTKVGYVALPDLALGIYVQGGLTYVADYYSGLRIIDVSVPSSPTEVGFYDTPGRARDVYVEGGLAYVADGGSGLRIIDVSVPSSPIEVGFYDTPDYAYGVYVQEGLAYVADYYSGLRIIDVSFPSSPVEVGFYDTPGRAKGVYVQDSLAYVADGSSGLRIIDVSFPSSSTEVGFYDTPGDAVGVYVQDSFAYVADYLPGIRIIDVSSSSSPVEVGFYDTPDVAWGVHVQGGFAYVADGWSGLRIIDVSSPSSPREVGFYDTGYAYGVYVQGGLAYVADYPSGLRIIDVSSPSSPREVGFYDTPDYACGVYVQGGFAYVANSYSGLRIIDVSSPSSPKEVGFYDTPGYACGVYVQGGLAYVADSYGGLIILRYTGGVPVYYGDVSGNGEITAFDASLILRVVVGMLQLNDPDYPYLTLDRADVSGNGTVSALDAALVLQYTVGLITQFPRQQSAGAPALDAEVEFKSPLTPSAERNPAKRDLYQRGESLTEAIAKLEAVPLDREGQQVLESLKRLIAEQSRAADAVGLSTALFQNFPNPFNPETWIPYELAQDAKVTIRIYNAKGQLIRALNLGEQKAGVYVTKDKAAYWDGRDSAGEKVANGVYFYTLRAGDFTATRRMVILK